MRARRDLGGLLGSIGAPDRRCAYSMVTAMTEIRLEARAHYSKPRLYPFPLWAGQNQYHAPNTMDILRAGWAAAQGNFVPGVSLDVISYPSG